MRKNIFSRLYSQTFLFLILSLFTFYGCSKDENPVEPIPEQQSDVFEQNKLLGKGINLGNALEAPTEGDWGVVIKDEYFSIIKNAGFNSVRIPIKWSAHALSTSPYTISQPFFSRVDWVVNQALKNGLAVIVNIHHYDEIMQSPLLHKERFLALWNQIAARYKDQSNKLFFEILNEPNTNLTASLWNQFVDDATKTIRQTNPNRTILVGLAEWGGVSALNQLKLPANEKNIILSFHYYNPFQFTHQGAEWVNGSNAWLGTKWTGSSSEMTAVINEFSNVLGWASRNNVPVNLGEFGAYSKADMESRVRWTSFVVQLCNQYGITWNYWEFAAGFGIYDQKTGKFNELYRALIPGNA